jgi:hypothetical protein
VKIGLRKGWKPALSCIRVFEAAGKTMSRATKISLPRCSSSRFPLGVT